MTKPRIPIQLYAPKYWGTWFALALLRTLSFFPYKWIYNISSLLGMIFYNIAKRRTKIIEKNIELCFPDKTSKEKQQLAHRAFTSTFMALFEVSISWWGTKEKLNELHTIEGLEHLNAALSKGKGVILLSSHFTTMEIAGAFLCTHIDNLILTYKRSNNPLFDFFIHRKRVEKSAGLVKHKNLREIIRNIKKGNVVWFAPDQDFGTKDSVFAPFMGIMTSTLLSTQRISKLTEAPVVPFYGARLDDKSGYIIRLSPELENFPSGDDVHDATTINKAIEQQIIKAPEQYLWAHRRFKTRPPGEADVYTKL